MTARTRTRQLTRTSGGSNYSNQQNYVCNYTQQPCGYETISDHTDTGDCRPLFIERLYSEGGIINRPDGGGFSSWACNKIAQWLIEPNLVAAHLSPSGVPNDFTVANQAAERTNPSRAHVNLAQTVLDVGGKLEAIQHEGRRMIRDYERRRVRDYARRTGQRWITYEFMLKPLVNDIVRAFALSTAIDRRINELNRLYGTNGLRRTVTIGQYEKTGSETIAVNSVHNILINRLVTTHTTVIRKCHIRWAPESPVALKPSPRQLHALARRATMGLHIDFALIWELIPWSWLIDWYGQCSTYLNATRNFIPARVTGVFPMTHTKTIRDFNSYISGSTRMTSGRSIRETKTRSVSAVTPRADFEFLNGNQIGILAAIGASRLR